MGKRQWLFSIVAGGLVLVGIGAWWTSRADQLNDPVQAAKRLQQVEVDLPVVPPVDRWDLDALGQRREELNRRIDALLEQGGTAVWNDEDTQALFDELNDLSLQMTRPEAYARRRACGGRDASRCSALALWRERESQLSSEELERAVQDAQDAGDTQRARDLLFDRVDWEEEAIEEALDAGESELARDMTLAAQRSTSSRQWTPERRMAQKWGLLLAQYAPNAQVEIIQAAELVGRDSQLHEPLAWLGGYPACDVRRNPELMVVCSPHYPYEY